MDDEGFVPVSVIAGFNRLQALTQDTDLIKEVSYGIRISSMYNFNVAVQSLQGSTAVEMRGDKIRKMHNWQVWVVGSRGQFSTVCKQFHCHCCLCMPTLYHYNTIVVSFLPLLIYIKTTYGCLACIYCSLHNYR